MKKKADILPDPTDLGLPAPKKPPTPNQVMRDAERTIQDPIAGAERIVKRVGRDVEKLLP